jgi:hypothetical protein
MWYSYCEHLASKSLLRAISPSMLRIVFFPDVVGFHRAPYHFHVFLFSNNLPADQNLYLCPITYYQFQFFSNRNLSSNKTLRPNPVGLREGENGCTKIYQA